MAKRPTGTAGRKPVKKPGKKSVKPRKGAAGKSAVGKRAGRGAAARAPRRQAPDRPWGRWALIVIAAAAVLRLAVNAAGLVPVHFDEAQYWAYGHEWALGHFSKPPLVGWLIAAVTGIGGDTTFFLRLGSVAAHAVVAGFVYLAGRRLFDGQTGFWAAAGYTVAPGVTVSAMVMSTDPVMMAAWAIALWAWIRAAEGDGLRWWVVMGIAIGAGMLAKYTMIAFVGAALGYGLFAPRGRAWRGTGIAGAVALVVFFPNLFWQLQNDFVTTRHVAEDAAPGGSVFNLAKMAEFAGAQFGVIGPVWFLTILAGLFTRDWWGDWRMRLLGWQCFALLVPIVVLAFVTRAQPNWAAPAYIGGSIFAARWLLTRRWAGALRWQAISGAVGAVALYGAAVAYAMAPLSLPRTPDPFKKMRIGAKFCAPALSAMNEEGGEALLSDDRRRLSECMFLGGLIWQDIAVWNPGPWPRNHHEMVASLKEGDDRPLILAVMSRKLAQRLAKKFREAREIESGPIRTHKDRKYSYSIWFVQGFKGY